MFQSLMAATSNKILNDDILVIEAMLIHLGPYNKPHNYRSSFITIYFTIIIIFNPIGPLATNQFLVWRSFVHFTRAIFL